MRRIRVALVPLAAAVTLAGCAGGIPPEPSATQNPQQGAAAEPTQTPTPTPTPKELPMGGREIFPAYRLVGYSGIAGSGPGLGRAGVGDIDDRMKEIAERGKPYAKDGRKIMPVLEYIATMVHPCKNAPKCRTVSSDEKVEEHLAAVRKVDGILLLAIQPGRSDFLSEVKRYEKYLKEPDVGIAMDPEWRMGPNQEPMRTFGSTDAKELNQVGDYLQKLVADNDLPEKVMLYHMIRVNWVRNHEDLKDRKGVVQILSVDGIGDQELKEGTWKTLMGVKPAHVHPGFKLFYQEDTANPGWKLMTPDQVMALTPTPDYVLYE
ncbi:LptM family lipoprotein [Mobilicoccus caccae]|uniref:Lipoprotein n=1 Tax=Mobilicoccus caccae TaxID=1859295 RepID=A0ABQ6IX43_9MICO|nr:hypothetical protein [Mobilicoccus caccae]GMA41264.1 hypothetical protein GCM10025883_33090 [Mobilicoccus caccae]